MTNEVGVKIVVDPSGAEAGAQRATRSLEGIRANARNARGAVGELSTAFSTLKRELLALAGFGGLAATIKEASVQAMAFERAMAEVSTLFSDTSNMNKLTQQVRELSKEFGSLPTAQAAALYEIISSGVEDVSKAVDILQVSNKLAIGGVTELKVAADGLTTILNSYGAAAGNATKVADAMFVAAAAGKTNIDQLSESLGKVAPIAKAAGVGFDELVSAVAALTKGGISTRESVTGLRAIIASILKPSDEAREMAKQLNLEWNASALASKGLAGFLEELTTKTRGNTTAISVLSGGVEALVPILALTGEAAGSFRDTLETVRTTSGQTEVAFDKMAKTMDERIKRLKGEFRDLAIDAGNAFNNVAVPAGETLLGSLDAIEAAVVGISIGAGILAINSLAGALTAAGGAATFFSGAFAGLSTIIMANPIGALAVAIAAVGATLYQLSQDTTKVGENTELSIGDIATKSWMSVAFAIQGAIEAAYHFGEVMTFGAFSQDDSMLARAQKAGDDLKTSLSDAWAAIKATWASPEIADVGKPFAGTLEEVQGILGYIPVEAEKAAGGINVLEKAEQDALKTFNDYIRSIETSIEVAKLEAAGNREQAELIAAESELRERMNRELLPKEIEQVEKLIKARRALNVEFSKYIQSTQLANNVQRAQLSGSDTLADSLKTEAELREMLGRDLLPAEIDQVNRLAAEHRALTIIYGDQQTAVEEFKSQYISGTNEVNENVERVTNRITDMFSEMAVSSGHALESLKEFALQVFREIAANAIIRPVVQGFVQNALGGAVQGAAGQAAGGWLSSMLPAGVGAGFASGGMMGGINALGSSMGFGTSVSGVSVGGMTTPGFTIQGSSSLFGGASLGSYLGAAGIGAGLGYLGGELFGARNNIATTIGGAGAGIALMAGNPALAAALFIGGQVLGQFGPRPSDRTQFSDIDFTNNLFKTGGFGGAKFSQENLDAATALGRSAQSIGGALSRASGGVGLTGRGFFEVGNQDGILANFNGASARFGTSTAGMAQAVGFMAQQMAAQLGDALPEAVRGALDNIDYSDATRAVADIGFVADFQNNLDALSRGAISFSELVEGQVTESVNAVIDQINAFRETTERLGLPVEEADTAIKAYVETLVGIREPAEKLTAIQAEFVRLDTTLEALRPLLEQVGIAFEDAAAAVEAAKETIRDNFEGGLLRRIEELNNPFTAGINRIYDDYNGMKPNAEFLGLTDTLDTWLTDSLKNLFQGFDATTLQSIITYYSTVKDNTTIVNLATVALGRLNTTVTDTGAVVVDLTENVAAIDKQIRTVSSNISELERSISAWENLGKALRNARMSLLLGASTSPLSTYDRLLAARGEFDRINELAKGGDQEAIADLPNLSKQLLEISKEYFGSSAGYFEDFEKVRSALVAAEGTAQTQIGILQDSLNVQQAMLATLQSDRQVLAGQIPVTGRNAGDLAAINKLYSDTRGTYFSNPNGTESGFKDTFFEGFKGKVLDIVNNYTDTSDAGKAALVSGYEWREERYNDPVYGDWYRELNNATAEQARKLGIPGFAGGGMSSSGMIQVGENGPEWLNLPRSAQVITHSQGESFQDGVVVAIRQSANLAAQQQRAIHETLMSMDATLKRMENTSRRRAARKEDAA